MLHAVILAGGSGTRFWPESRRARPKHLLRFGGERPLVAETAERLGVPPERTWVVTTDEQAPSIRGALPDLPEGRIIVEPCGRDTAAAMGLGAKIVSDADPEALMVVMPADHVIRPVEAFRADVALAADLLAARPDAVVTLGIRPTHPATGFGYIQRRAALEGAARAHLVERFHEKPDAERAARYLADGGFFWNAGIFVWRARALLDAIERHLPATREVLERPADARTAAYADLEKISIDFAVLEKHEEVLCIEASFTWSDVGSWTALPELFGEDERGSTVVDARLVPVDAERLIVHGRGRVVAAVGVSDLVIVDTDDALLVCHRDRVQSVKTLVQTLEREGPEDVL